MRAGGEPRRSVWVPVALVSVLALVGNLATETVEVPGAAVPWLWAATVVLVVAVVGVEVRRHRTEESTASAGVGLEEAAGRLAVAVGAQWRREEQRRRVHTPYPLPVRWHAAPAVLMDHWANIGGASAGAPAGPVELAGRVDRILETYRRIPSGRVVVLGRAGSGKTIVALRFVLDLLDQRAPDEPVPVIIGLGSWNPATTSLRDWLTERLIRDHPGLAAPDPSGTSLAAALIATGRMLPVLDGFDEIANGLHRDALAGLNTVTGPLLLTSRPQEYATAVTAAHTVLANAATIELADLTLDDLTDYLPRTTRTLTTTDGTTTAWNPVLDHLRDHPDSPAATNLLTTLSTPLMTGLARTIYSDTPDHNPADLLDTHRFGTPHALEDHLLGTFVPAIYQHPPLDRPTNPDRRRRPRRYDLHRAHHWLGYLAHHLNRLDTRNLAWWELGKTIPRIPGTILIILTMLLLSVLGTAFWLVVIIMNGVVLELAGWIPAEANRDFATQTLDGIVTGVSVLNFALTALFLFADSDEYRPAKVGRYTGRPAQVLTAVVFSGVLFGAAAWLLVGLDSGVQVGLAGGLVCGVTYGTLTQFWTPADITTMVSPRALLTMDRRKVTVQVLACWGVFELVLLVGLAVGAGGDYGYALGFLTTLVAYTWIGTSVWFRWLILARCVLPLTRKLPWALITFLEDAHQQGVLRQAGAVYQFRHARLQDHLAHHYQTPHNS